MRHRKRYDTIKFAAGRYGRRHSNQRTLRSLQQVPLPSLPRLLYPLIFTALLNPLFYRYCMILVFLFIFFNLFSSFSSLSLHFLHLLLILLFSVFPLHLLHLLLHLLILTLMPHTSESSSCSYYMLLFTSSPSHFLRSFPLFSLVFRPPSPLIVKASPTYLAQESD